MVRFTHYLYRLAEANRCGLTSIEKILPKQWDKTAGSVNKVLK
jgi:hypothetical protein